MFTKLNRQLTIIIGQQYPPINKSQKQLLFIHKLICSYMPYMVQKLNVTKPKAYCQLPIANRQPPKAYYNLFNKFIASLTFPVSTNLFISFNFDLSTSVFANSSSISNAFGLFVCKYVIRFFINSLA